MTSIARADCGAPFVVGHDKCGELRAHLATRKLLTLAEDKLTGFELVRGSHRELAEKRGPAWYTGAARLERMSAEMQAEARHHQLQAGLDEVLASTSWRLTAPLRRLSAALKARRTG